MSELEYDLDYPQQQPYEAEPYEAYTDEYPNEDLSAQDEFDPARRRGRRWLFDPARARGQRKSGRRQPAALRRYWAARRGYHPRHRGRRHADPARRRRRGRRSHFDPARRFGRMFRRRRYDPTGIGSPGGVVDTFADFLINAAGGTIHNIAVHKQGLGARTYQVGPVKVTQAGLGALVVGLLGRYFRWWGEGNINNLLKGVFNEGLNIPALEGLERVGPGQTATGGGGLFGGNVGPGPGPMNPAWSLGQPSAPLPSASNMNAPAGVDYSYITPWGYT